MLQQQQLLRVTKKFFNPIVNPDADPNHYQNLITFKLHQVEASLKISAESPCNFLDNPVTKRETEKKFELMLTRRVKVQYSSSCSQTVSLSRAISSQFIFTRVCCSRRLLKSIKTPYFKSSGSFKVIDVDMTRKLVTSACCDRQHALSLIHI